MMLSVTFKDPIVIEEKNLSALLALAGVAAVVAPHVEAKRPGRKPAAPAAGQSASSEAPEAVKPPGKKRGRKSAAEKAAAAAEPPVPVPERKKPGRKPKTAVAAPTPEAPAPEAPAAPVAPTGDLLERFAALIDSDFEGAKGILDQMGVERFSDLPESEYPAFDAAMQKLGA